jgi:hypothetical protein
MPLIKFLLYGVSINKQSTPLNSKSFDIITTTITFHGRTWQLLAFV